MSEDVENLKNKSNWGGIRPNAGRKKGGENKAKMTAQSKLIYPHEILAVELFEQEIDQGKT